MNQVARKSKMLLWAGIGVAILVLAIAAYFLSSGGRFKSNLIPATGYPVSIGVPAGQDTITVASGSTFSVPLMATGASATQPLLGVKLTLDAPSYLLGTAPTFSAAPDVSNQTVRVSNGKIIVLLSGMRITNSNANLGTLNFTAGANVANGSVSTFSQAGSLLVSEISGASTSDPNSYVTFSLPNGVLFNIVAGTGGNNNNQNTNNGPFTVTHRVVAGQGTITPPSPITNVPKGDSVNLVIDPATCFTIQSITDNQTDVMGKLTATVGLVATDTFEYNIGNIDANHEVLVSFAVSTDPACANTNQNSGNVNLNGLQSPVITSINPTSGTAGVTQNVLITGVNFSASGNTITLTNKTTGNSTTVTPKMQSTTQLTFDVPNIAAGPYAVTVTTSGNLTSNSVDFTINPNGNGNGNNNGTFTISINPTSGPTGTPVTVTTPGGFPNGSTNTVTFTCPGNTTNTQTITAGSSGTLSFNVPSGLNPGQCTVTVSNNNGTGTTTFTVTTGGGNGNQNNSNGGNGNNNGSLGAVTLTSINPNNTNSGQTITLTGTGFGTGAGVTNTVVFVPTGYCPGQTTVTAPGNASSATSMTTTVPTLASCTYNVFVQVSNATQTVNSNSLPFTIGTGSTNTNTNGSGITITGLNPVQGPVGTQLDITGTGFGTNNNNTVTFVPGGNCPATQAAVSVTGVDSNGTLIDNLPVPNLALCTYSVYVSTGGQSSNPAKFTVTANGTNPVPVATITGVTPNPATQGGPLTINGTGFNPVNTVIFTCGAQTATLTNVYSNGSEIRVTLPSNLTGSCTVVVNNGNGPSNAFPFIITASGNSNQNNSNSGGGTNNNNNGSTGPNVPQNVRAFGDPQSQQVIVMWDPVSGASGYNIFRINDGQQCSAGVQVGSVGTQTTFVYNEPTAGTYRYCVSSLVNNVESGRGGPSNAVTVGTNMNGFVDGGINPGFLILPFNSIVSLPLTAENSITDTVTWTYRGFNSTSTPNNNLLAINPATGRTVTIKPVVNDANKGGGVAFVTATGANGSFSTIPVIIWQRGDTDGDFVTGPVDQNNVINGWDY